MSHNFCICFKNFSSVEASSEVRMGLHIVVVVVYRGGREHLYSETAFNHAKIEFKRRGAVYTTNI